MTATVPADIVVQAIQGSLPDAHRRKVEQTYGDDPALWQKVIGPALWFQFGVYEPGHGSSLDESGRRHFERQLDLAGRLVPGRGEPTRILDVGYGWGSELELLARRYPGCPRLDGVNVSGAQSEYAALRLAAAGLAHRVNLYLCSAEDVALLPESGQPYDLVVMRGSITHFSYVLLEATMTALAGRVREGTPVVISESLYRIPPDRYRSAIPDLVDRLGCGHRKSMRLLMEVLERSSFAVRDARLLPSNDDVIRWLAEVRANIVRHFPDTPPQALEELRDTADNWTVALRCDEVSVYSVIAERVAPGS